jgi:tetratricopeptide (TPR) repeat protein
VNFHVLGAFILLFGALSCRGAAEPGSSPVATVTAQPPADTNVLAEFARIEAADDAAQAEVDKWVRENNELKSKGQGVSEEALQRRINERFEPVRQAYDAFVQAHPNIARARMGYGNFLNDREDEAGAQVQWEKALELDPTNPATYNSLAGRYSESGPVNKAFQYFERAIELSPGEAVYYHNFGDVLYVLRKRAATYYGISEQDVFGKVLLVYSNAVRLDPRNFVFERDLAQTYYSVKPFQPDVALGVWTNAFSAAREETDREDVYVHMARVKMLAGWFAEARAQLTSVTNQASLNAKTTLLHNIEEREKEAASNSSTVKQEK